MGAQNVKTAKVAAKKLKKPSHDRNARVIVLMRELDEARGERDHLSGLVNALRAERETLRLRVLKAAAGTICSRCEEETPETPQVSPAPEPTVPPVAAP